MNNISLELKSDTELRLAASFLTALADHRGVLAPVALRPTLPAVELGLAPAHASADAAMDEAVARKFVIRNSAGEPSAMFDTGDEWVTAMVAIFEAAPNGESLNNIFAVNSPEMRKLTKPLLDEVTFSYGAKAAGFNNPELTAPAPAPADKQKRKSAKQKAAEAAAENPPATAAAESAPQKPNADSAATPAPVADATSLFEEIGVDSPKSDAATATVAAGSTASPISAPASVPPATSAPLASNDPAELEKTVHALMMAFIKKVGYAGGVAYMARFGAKRFSEVQKGDYPTVHAQLATDEAQAAVIKELFPNGIGKKG